MHVLVGDMRWTSREVCWQAGEQHASAHTQGVAVRDVKLENMLLTRPRGDRRSLLKICDFGYSKVTACQPCCMQA